MWEYTVLRVTAYLTHYEIEALLNQWGREGWELISTDVDDTAVSYLYLKRQLK